VQTSFSYRMLKSGRIW